jgi:ATP-dependent helicase/nuclease subunit A
MHRLSGLGALFARHSAANYQRFGSEIAAALATGVSDQERLTALTATLLTGKQERRAIKLTGTLIKSLGRTDAERLLSDYAAACDWLDAVRERIARHASFHRTRAWVVAGTRLLDHYTRIKQAQRLLDFTDLEWKAFWLLHHAGQAHWVQYKLDARIDHILIDEFQDTNPTQWRLLLPLLEELAAGGDRERSVFLVGDVKQSIYRFRRAEPRLMHAASDWMDRSLGARAWPMQASYRSAPVIIELVNRVFGSGALADVLTDFNPHTTHRVNLWGRVEVLSLIEPPADAAAETQAGLRNPLTTPRATAEDRRHADEAQRIAAHIRAMIDACTPVAEDDTARPLAYDDIVILLRGRTHAALYETALRAADIPYLGADRGTLLTSLEVRDMLALLEHLLTPFNNLALAQVLRSPLFAADDNELIALAGAGTGNWADRLARAAAALPPHSGVARAAEWLPRWHRDAGRLPVHDLLDRIYHQGNVLKRYLAAFPPALHPRVLANLDRFMELALEVDSGRYPSLAYFVERLKVMTTHGDDAPDEAVDTQAEARVRLMTIHAAKGLEAPVVYLADTSARRPDKDAYRPVIDWPAQAEQPELFMLTTRRQDLDRISGDYLDAQALDRAQDEANLLYVALTRARQYLIVSACWSDRLAGSWYQQITDSLTDLPRADADGWRLTCGQAPSVSRHRPQQPPLINVDAALAVPLRSRPTLQEIAPSRAGDAYHAGDDPDARRRGLVLHRMLDMRTSPPTPARAQVLLQLRNELSLENTEDELIGWWDEAESVVETPALAALFDARLYDAAHNEVPIQYMLGERTVHGIIDRIVVYPDRIVVIDYKTHADATAETAAAIAGNYREQLALYARGAALLWPGRRVEAALLFTACGLLWPIESPPSP